MNQSKSFSVIKCHHHCLSVIQSKSLITENSISFWVRTLLLAAYALNMHHPKRNRNAAQNISQIDEEINHCPCEINDSKFIMFVVCGRCAGDFCRIEVNLLNNWRRWSFTKEHDIIIHDQDVGWTVLHDTNSLFREGLAKTCFVPLMLHLRRFSYWNLPQSVARR